VLTIDVIKKFFPNAHSNWVLILVKPNGKKNFKTKKEKDFRLWPLVEAIQEKQAQRELH